MICVVLKEIPAGEKVYRPGQIVDTTTWRWTEKLIAQRYLRVADPDESTSLKRSHRGSRPQPRIERRRAASSVKPLFVKRGKARYA